MLNKHSLKSHQAGGRLDLDQLVIPCEIKTVTPNLSFLSLMFIHSFMWKLNQSHQLFGGGQELQIYWLPVWLPVSFRFYYKCETTYLCHLESETPNLTFEILFRLKLFSANIFKKLWLQTPGSSFTVTYWKLSGTSRSLCAGTAAAWEYRPRYSRLATLSPEK